LWSLKKAHDEARRTLLQRIAQATGMQPADVAQHLSNVLPHIVDHVTPNGQI
jgi:uncharacterized protein YidB (DUF937 family)